MLAGFMPTCTLIFFNATPWLKSSGNYFLEFFFFLRLLFFSHSYFSRFHRT
jgi:hypothetical protein